MHSLLKKTEVDVIRECTASWTELIYEKDRKINKDCKWGNTSFFFCSNSWCQNTRTNFFLMPQLSHSPPPDVPPTPAIMHKGRFLGMYNSTSEQTSLYSVTVRLVWKTGKNFHSDISWCLSEIHNLNSKASSIFQIFESESCNCDEMFIENVDLFPTEILLLMKSIATFFIRSNAILFKMKWNGKFMTTWWTVKHYLTGCLNW